MSGPGGMACGLCKWWKDAYRMTDNRPTDMPGPFDRGECHRRSPKSVKVGMGLHRDTVWPRIEARDWCGDFEMYFGAYASPDQLSQQDGPPEDRTA